MYLCCDAHAEFQLHAVLIHKHTQTQIKIRKTTKQHQSIRAERIASETGETTNENALANAPERASATKKKYMNKIKTPTKLSKNVRSARESWKNAPLNSAESTRDGQHIPTHTYIHTETHKQTNTSTADADVGHGCGGDVPTTR